MPLHNQGALEFGMDFFYACQQQHGLSLGLTSTLNGLTAM